jgi:hypothetical protein
VRHANTRFSVLGSGFFFANVPQNKGGQYDNDCDADFGSTDVDELDGFEADKRRGFDRRAGSFFSLPSNLIFQ